MRFVSEHLSYRDNVHKAYVFAQTTMYYIAYPNKAVITNFIVGKLGRPKIDKPHSKYFSISN